MQKHTLPGKNIHNQNLDLFGIAAPPPPLKAAEDVLRTNPIAPKLRCMSPWKVANLL